MRHQPALYRESAFDRLHWCSGGSGRIRTRDIQHRVGKTIPLHYGSTPHLEVYFSSFKGISGSVFRVHIDALSQAGWECVIKCDLKHTDKQAGGVPSIAILRVLGSLKLYSFGSIF